MKEKFNKLMTKPWAAYTFAACSAVIVYLLLTNLGVVFSAVHKVYMFLSPVIIGVVVAYVFNPIEDFIEKKILAKTKNEKSRHGTSVFLTILTIVIILAIFLVVLIPSIVKSISKLIENWDGYVSSVEGFVAKAEEFAVSHNVNFDFQSIHTYLDNATDTLATLVKNNYQTILSAAGNVGTSVSNFAVGVLFGFCFLFSEKFLIDLVNKVRKAFMKPQTIERHNELFSRCNKIFVRYLSCTFLDSFIITVCVLIFTLVMGMEYAPLIAIVCGFTNIIPTIGPWIGTGIGIFFLVLSKPINALWFFIFCCVLQSIDGMLIKPKLFKNGLGIPAVFSFVLLIVGGKIAGMAGIILSIPVGAVLEIIYVETIVPWLEKRSAAKKENGEKTEDEQPDAS